MNAPFAHYRKTAMATLTELRRDFEEHALNEQAIPSYLSENSLLRFTFWRRLEVVANALARKPRQSVLDFGCGLGALFPFLSAHCDEFYAYDIFSQVTDAAKRGAECLKISNVRFLSSEAALNQLPKGSLDAIVALDVLEHVENLDQTLALFERVLKPTGELIVCSPTEYRLYKLARKFGGKGYQGEYHLRAADDVEADLARFFKVRVVGRIYPVFPFFRVVSCTRRSG